jgi:hypothetical protein
MHWKHDPQLGFPRYQLDQGIAQDVGIPIQILAPMQR